MEELVFVCGFCLVMERLVHLTPDGDYVKR